MGSLYGFFATDCNAKFLSDSDKLEIWNNHYGTIKSEVICGESKYMASFASTVFKYAGEACFMTDKSCFSLDVVIYNREELLAELDCDGTISDAELLAILIESKGIAAIKDVNGDFAGAVFNSKENKLTLFTDHMGIRPLYYYSTNKQVIFSTDIRGLTALEEVNVALNPEWVYNEIVGQNNFDSEKTEYKYIYRVKPASYIEFDLSTEAITKTVHEYWALGKKKIRKKNRQAYADELRELIQDSVKKRVEVCGETVGAELSGGLDSGVIDILINRLGKKGIYFSWSLSPDELPYAEKNDERKVIDAICQQENIECHFYRTGNQYDDDRDLGAVTSRKGLKNGEVKYPAIAYGLPSFINALTINTTAEYIASKKCGVVFSGHGGDEGVSHRCNPYELFYHHEYYRYLRQKWAEAYGGKNRFVNMLRRIKSDFSFAKKYTDKSFSIDLMTKKILKESFVEENKNAALNILYFAFDSIKYINSGATMVRLNNAATLAAYSGVQYIFPYLDYRVIDYAVSIPRYLYLKGKQNRYVFREAFKDIMPKELYQVRVKEDGSTASMTANKDWYEKYGEIKQLLIDGLDRNLWKDYIDFDKLKAWFDEPRPSDEDRDIYEMSMIFLFQAYLADNMIKKSRMVHRPSDEKEKN